MTLNISQVEFLVSIVIADSCGAFETGASREFDCIISQRLRFFRFLVCLILSTLSQLLKESPNSDSSKCKLS